MLNGDLIPYEDVFIRTRYRNIVGGFATIALFTWTPLALLIAFMSASDMSFITESPLSPTTVAEYVIACGYVASSGLPLVLMIGTYRYRRGFVTLAFATLLISIITLFLV